MSIERNSISLLRAKVLRFVVEKLGLQSAQLLKEPEKIAEVFLYVEDGLHWEDAAMKVVFEEAIIDRKIADEFLTYFQHDLYLYAKSLLNSSIRKLVESSDLVQSILGDFWADPSRLEFRGRSQFKTLLQQRLKWKVIDKSRWMKSKGRREDLQVSGNEHSIEHCQNTEPSPESLAGEMESKMLITLAFASLPKRDAKILRLWLEKESVKEIARSLEMTEPAVRSAIVRAIGKLAKLTRIQSPSVS